MDKKIKIAIINLTAGGISEGYRKYLNNMLPRLASYPEVEGLLCVFPFQLSLQDQFAHLLNIEFIKCKPFKFMHHNPEPELKKHLERFSPDVIFVPLERYFRFDGVPLVTMIQNMGPLVSPVKANPFSEKIRWWAQTIEAKIAIKKADRIIAISNFVKVFLIKQLKVPIEKISLIYFGAELPTRGRIQKPVQIPEDWKHSFVFTAGSIDPYRGLEDILLATKFMASRNEGIKIVIAGEARPKMISYQKKLIDLSKKYNVLSKVCWAGRLNEDEMAWCYKNCNAFLMTSRVEACPNIALEAMANGCLSISAENPPLPEFFEDAAIYYPPGDVKTLTEIIQRVFGWDNAQRNLISKKAKKRAAQFSWDVTVKKTVNELNMAIRDFRLGNYLK